MTEPRPYRDLLSPFLGATLPALGVLLMLGGVIPGGKAAPADLGELGGTCSALLFLAASVAWWRRFRTARGLNDQPPAHRRARLLREARLLAGLCLIGPALGAAYFHLGGQHAANARHARIFALLGPAMFLVFAPRPQEWAPSEPQP